MIRLEIDAETSADLIAQIMALAAGFVLSAPVDVPAETEVEEKHAAPKSSRKAPAKAETKAEEPVAEKEDVSKSETPSSAAGDFNVEGVDPTNKDSVRAYLSASIDILGGPAVTEVFSEFGATSFKGIAAEQYAPMIVRLDELRQLKEQEG